MAESFENLDNIIILHDWAKDKVQKRSIVGH